MANYCEICGKHTATGIQCIPLPSENKEDLETEYPEGSRKS